MVFTFFTSKFQIHLQIFSLTAPIKHFLISADFLKVGLKSYSVKKIMQYLDETVPFQIFLWALD
jgi:hypothetical protein